MRHVNKLARRMSIKFRLTTINTSFSIIRLQNILDQSVGVYFIFVFAIQNKQTDKVLNWAVGLWKRQRYHSQRLK